MVPPVETVLSIEIEIHSHTTTQFVHKQSPTLSIKSEINTRLQDINVEVKWKQTHEKPWFSH